MAKKNVFTVLGWAVPPPKEPEKSAAELKRERERKVTWLVKRGFLKNPRLKEAMLKVKREAFIPRLYRDYTYLELPLLLPGKEATISCPHSYPLFYEPLGLSEGHRFLEVGLGSGYGAALAREVVGEGGLVVSVEIDPATYGFAKNNLENAGYRDIVLVCGDGGEGYPPQAPYDRICITAACSAVPSPLLEELSPGGRLIAPLTEYGLQTLTLFEKTPGGMEKKAICEVLYINLRGKYGV